MGSRGGRSSFARPRAALVAVVVVAVALGVAAGPAASATGGNDAQIAKAAIFVLADFPAGFTAEPSSGSSHADNIRLAKGVGGCAPYILLQRAVDAVPSAFSPDFKDAYRTVSNEVDVFKSERSARDALALYAKPSIVGCLKKLFEKRLRQDPKVKNKVDVVVALQRQDIAGLGDDSVVYEGTVDLTGTDGSTAQLRIGNAAVQVGRTVNAVSYSTTGDDLVDVLTAAIDASVGRLRSALNGERA
jgi:hypothetical protein